jgi:hypothetical protein
MDDTRDKCVRSAHPTHVTCCRSSIPCTSHADVVVLVHMMHASYARHSSSKYDVKCAGSAHHTCCTRREKCFLAWVTFGQYCFTFILTLVPVISCTQGSHGLEKSWKVLEFWKKIQGPWKSLEFCALWSFRSRRHIIPNSLVGFPATWCFVKICPNLINWVLIYR